MTNYLSSILCFIGALVFVVVAPASSAQGVLTVSTDKPEYALGEAIEIRVTMSNPTSELFNLVVSSTCQGLFRFDDFDVAQSIVCTADATTIQYPPGSERTFIYTLEPHVLGLPTSDGTHSIIGYHMDSALMDTVTVSAPEYLGGRVSIGLDSSRTQNDVESLKDSLFANVITTFQSSQGISEIWEISGVSIDSAATLYSQDARFRYFEVYRVVPNHVILGTEDDQSTVRDVFSTDVYPNPCRPECTIRITSTAAQSAHISLVDVLGRNIVNLGTNYFAPGRINDFLIDTRSFGSGIYFIAIEANGYSETQPLVVVE